MSLSLSSRIERRLLVNWRAAPEVVTPLLPPGFRPQLVDGSAVVGICFLRLARIHPHGIPDAVSLRSESAAHRIAVERDTPDGVEQCVYVLRRVTSSRVAALAGGRLFPGVHSYARFQVDDRADRLAISFATAGGQHDAAVSVEVTDSLQSSLFPDIGSMASFFRGAPIGWSPRRRPGPLDGVELVTQQWPMSPAALRSARSNFFGNTKLFPTGSIELDSAVVMRDIPVSWLAVPNAEAAA